MIEAVSISQLGMFLRCPEQYRRRYLEEERIPPGIAAKIGQGVHKAAEANYREKIQTGQDMPLDAIQDAAAEGYMESLSRGVFFAPGEASSARAQMAKGKDTAVVLAGLFRSEVAPDIHPELIEEKIYLDEPRLPLPIVGVVDCYTTGRRLSDLKTSSKKWGRARADESPQASLYARLIKERTGEPPAAITFDVLVANKAPVYQQVPTTRTAEDYEIVIRKFGIMLAQIQAGLFPPAAPGAWNCSPRWCGYWYTCPYISAHRKILPKRST